MLFLKLMNEGGPLMWIILAGALLGLFFFLEKTFQFHREEINVRELLHGLTNVLERDGIVEALTLCDNTPGPDYDPQDDPRPARSPGSWARRSSPTSAATKAFVRRLTMPRWKKCRNWNGISVLSGL